LAGTGSTGVPSARTARAAAKMSAQENATCCAAVVSGSWPPRIVGRGSGCGRLWR
jgi:hypothetical protein